MSGIHPANLRPDRGVLASPSAPASRGGDPVASLPVDSVELQGKAPRQDSEAPVQRTLFDRLFPERAAQREEDAHLSRDLITGWHQTTQGNCATVATIKASLHKWGDEVFAKHTRDREGNHHVTLRDGHQVLVTAKELETATRMSHFVGDKKRALKKANLCYAVMAKRALEEKHEGANTFVKACKSLNNGEKVTQPAHYLGVADSL